MNITQKNSPNFSAGRGGKKIEYVICHWIVGRIAAADAVFAKANSTSAHYAVDDNKIHQYVSEDNTAWHAGNFDVNQRSIGIEHAGGPNIPITDATYETSAQLIADIWRRRGKLPLRKHNEFKATQCPGTLDIGRLERRANEILTPPPPTEDPRLADYRNRISALEGQLQTVKSELEAVKINRDDLAALVEQRNIELGKLQVELADVKKELEKSNEIALGWIGKNDQLELELEKMTEKISKLQNDIKTARPVTGIARLVEALINWRKK